MHRKAFTLIELLMSLAIGSSVVLGAVTLLHRSFAIRRGLQEQESRSREMGRLVRQLQMDVRSSQQAEMSDAVLLLRSPGTTISYEGMDGGIRRVEKWSEEGSQRNIPQRLEAFSFGQATECSFEVLQSPNRVFLSADYRDPRLDDARRPLRRVQVVVGSWTITGGDTYDD